MNGNRRYILDANVFIEAKNKYYRFDVCPGFWNALIAQHKKDRIISIDRVRGELIKKSKPDEPIEDVDRLSEWARQKVPGTFFKKTQDKEVIDAFQEMVNWVNSETQFTPAAKAEFADIENADGWVVAYAKVNGLVVVTHEEYAPAVQRKVPVPNVCLEFGVDPVNTFEMLAELKVKLILSTKRPRGR
jgi:hypothetical protein